MMSLKIIITGMIFSILYIILSPIKLYAYLDPGSGSYILQILIAGLLSGMYVLKVYWKRIKIFFEENLSGKRNGKKLKK